jgi:hypothetical protein
MKREDTTGRTTPEHECRECGKATVNGAAFCRGHVCRTAWHNRRKARGAEVLDLLQEHASLPRSGKAGEAVAKRRGELLSQIGRVLSAYRAADVAMRDGLPSWNADEALARIPLAYGRTGDGR